MFAIQLPEKQAIHAALAGKYDHLGQRQSISQFMNRGTQVGRERVSHNPELRLHVVGGSL